ncbi:MAG: PD40 domain-containing protein [Gemmatimonadota bacterium]|nr:MAG: PD40 domain-containing protein [Gemmatimonadota bacterium]
MTENRLAATLLCFPIVFLAACGSQGSPAVARAVEEGERFFANLRQLTFGGQNAEAYFSPDGTRLIFQRTGTESECDQQYVIGIDGTGLRRVSNGLGRTTCGYFYEGGSRVLYSSTAHASESCPPPPDYSLGYVWALYDFDIYTSMTDGSDLTRLTETDGYTAEATLSPDGGTIVFTSVMNGDLDIYTMKVDGTNLKQLTSTVGYDGGPFFSPDGSMIVYRSWHPTSPDEVADYRRLLAQGLIRPSQMEVWVMNADGSDQRQVTSLGHANFAPFFHPDGRRIIFSSNHETGERDFNLYLIGVDGTGLTQVTHHADFDGFPMFSSDGTKLVFASNRYGSVPGETNIFIADWVEP